MPGYATQLVGPKSVDSPQASDLEMLFNRLFLPSHRTLLIGGADEPLYQPASAVGDKHRLYYRLDYFSSALHEIAHWCLAGETRRKQLDYGYWYVPDGRNPGQQAEFEAVEARPQALEWIFARACGTGFRPSTDNLVDTARDGTDFALAIARQAQGICRTGLPARASRFHRTLCDYYANSPVLDVADFEAGHW